MGEQTPGTSSTTAARKPVRWQLATAVAVLVFVGVPVMLRVFVLEAFKIPSGAMIPTLLVGDHVFVNKLSSGDAGAGEVWVFDFPENPKQAFIKRVIATGGQRFEALDGRPIIDGKLIPHCHAGSYVYEGRTVDAYVERLGSTSYLTVFDGKPTTQACTTDADCGGGDITCHQELCGMHQGPWTVPATEVWVMGDNRNNSHDSRSWRAGVGAGVPHDHLTGKAAFYWMRGQPGAPNFIGIHDAPRLGKDHAALQAGVDRCVKELGA